MEPAFFSNPLRSNPSPLAGEAKWNALQAEYRAAYAAFQDHEVALAVKYGDRRNIRWASRGEQKKLEQLRARADRIADRMYKMLERSATRDWRHGVPAHWIAEKLTWADAVKPPGESLSVEPPRAFGY